jgi:hypothetical protein
VQACISNLSYWKRHGRYQQQQQHVLVQQQYVLQLCPSHAPT